MPARSLDELLSIEAIREKLALYCRAMDRMDDELGLALWTADAQVEYTGIFTGSAAAFIAYSHSVHESMAATKHRMANHLIRIDGDRAVSEADGRITLATRDGEGALVRTSFGRYLDNWVRRDGEWLIDRRRYTRDFSLVSRPALEVGPGVRSRDDPSYEHFPDLP